MTTASVRRTGWWWEGWWGSGVRTRELVECNELDTALRELAEYGELGMDPETTSVRTSART